MIVFHCINYVFRLFSTAWRHQQILARELFTSSIFFDDNQCRSDATDMTILQTGGVSHAATTPDTARSAGRCVRLRGLSLGVLRYKKGRGALESYIK